MLRLDEMDERVTLREQMATRAGPVVLINTFTVAPEEADQLLEAWAADAAFMKAQPGFISTQLHRGIGKSSVFLNYAIWESADAFARAFARPEFRSSLAKYPPSTVASPHLFSKVAVPGICVA
jgi:heme-degrading monooxygenase HmoA